MARGDKILGEPCVVNAAHVVGKSVRYVSNGNCVLCSLAREQSQTGEKRKEYMKQWRAVRKRLGLPTD